jgi:GNAT superfamily N-acetyltransferase
VIAIRPAGAPDADAVADVYLASYAATYPGFERQHTEAEIRAWIASVVVPAGGCWVADDEGQVVAMMALAPGWIDQLYVAPDRLGEGIGRRLLELAMSQAEGRLELWTFQANERARRFYERNGFAAVELTDGRGNEERQPDVRYVWRRPGATA